MQPRVILNEFTCWQGLTDVAAYERNFSCLSTEFTYMFWQMILEQPEDMWHAYNLIAEGDRILSSTVRYLN